MELKLSVITICYNEPRVEATIKSVLNQTFQDFEWIVIDGGSFQETIDIFNKYKSRINIFISEPDSGIYNAMNKGIKLAHGEYLLFLNAGDTFYDNKVLSRFVKDKSKKDIIYANRYRVKNGKAPRYPNVLDKNFWIVNTLAHQATLIKRDLFDKYGLYNENYKIVSDYEKWIEFIYVNKCSYKHLNFTGCYFDDNGISESEEYNELHKAERNSVMRKYWTQEEIDFVRAESLKMHFSLLERIFSIKNNSDNLHKTLTILGISFKIKRKGRNR